MACRSWEMLVPAKPFNYDEGTSKKTRQSIIVGLLRSQRIMGQLLGVAIPIGAMVGLHVQWMQDRNAKLRMLAKHIGFWGGMAATLYVGHRYGFRAKGFSKALAIFVGSSPFPIIGYYGMKQVAARLFPKKKPELPMLPPIEQLISNPEKPSFNQSVLKPSKPPTKPVANWTYIQQPPAGYSAYTPAYSGATYGYGYPYTMAYRGPWG